MRLLLLIARDRALPSESTDEIESRDFLIILKFVKIDPLALSLLIKVVRLKKSYREYKDEDTHSSS